MTNQRVIIITGMHRSGTSLVTNLLQASGLDIGNELLEANTGNPYGYLEDLEFLEFQRQLLRSRGMDMFVTERFDFFPTQPEINQAKNLIAKRETKKLWGWKDPRTSLFLEFWDQLLPDANYILLYRHPLDVVISLLRRGDFSENGQVELGLRSWCIYNKNIFEFFQKRPEKCILCDIYQVVDNLENFQFLLNEKICIDLVLSRLHPKEFYHPTILQRSPITEEVNNILSKIHPPTIELFRQLNKSADLPASQIKNSTSSALNLNKFNSLLSYFPVPPKILQVRSLLLLLVASLRPDFFEQFYSEITRALQKITDDRNRFWENTRAQEQKIQQYEAMLQSQDMMVRQVATLTFNNILDIWRKPEKIKKKIERWIHYRIKAKDNKQTADTRVEERQLDSLVSFLHPEVTIEKTNKFTAKDLGWIEAVYSLAPKAIAIVHPEWRGVRSATVNLFPVVKFVDDTLDKEKACTLACILAETGCKRFVFCGFALSHQHLIVALNALIPTAKIYVFWLGNFLQSSENYSWRVFRLVQDLCKSGRVYKWGFAKQGMAETMAHTGIRTGFVMSMVNQITTAPSEPLMGGPHLGVWSLGSNWRKPPYAMLAASLMIPGAVVHGSGADRRVQKFAEAMQINSELRADVIPQDLMPAVLAQMHLNLYVTLSECAPMLPLESLSVGVPCLLGPNSHLFEDHAFLHKTLVVPYPDSSAKIAEMARQALERRVEIIEQYSKYAPEYNQRAKASLAAFLEVG